MEITDYEIVYLHSDNHKLLYDYELKECNICLPNDEITLSHLPGFHASLILTKFWENWQKKMQMNVCFHQLPLYDQLEFVQSSR